MVLIFTNWQKTLKINKLEAGRIIYGMLKAVGYEEWYFLILLALSSPYNQLLGILECGM